MRDPPVLFPKKSPDRPFFGKFCPTPGPWLATPGPVIWLLPPVRQGPLDQIKRGEKPADYVRDKELRRLLEKKTDRAN